MTTDFSVIGKRIANLRKEKGYTQERLAEALDMSSVYISHIENSRSIPSLETVVKLCNALDITPDSILIGSDKRGKEYLMTDISTKINNCTSKEKKLISGFIDLVIAQREK